MGALTDKKNIYIYYLSIEFAHQKFMVAEVLTGTTNRTNKDLN